MCKPINGSLTAPLAMTAGKSNVLVVVEEQVDGALESRGVNAGMRTLPAKTEGRERRETGALNAGAEAHLLRASVARVAVARALAHSSSRTRAY